METKDFDPIHPGEVLLEEYLKPMGVSQNKLALNMRVPPQQISSIVNGRRPITVETAVRLSMVIGTTPEFWLALQAEYDLRVFNKEKGPQVKKEVQPIYSRA